MTHTVDCGCKAEEIFHEKDSWGREGAIRIDIVYCPMHKAAQEMLEALKEIAKMEGAYSRDPLTHAENVIENLTNIANKAIAKVESE